MCSKSKPKADILYHIDCQDVVNNTGIRLFKIKFDVLIEFRFFL